MVFLGQAIVAGLLIAFILSDQRRRKKQINAIIFEIKKNNRIDAKNMAGGGSLDFRADFSGGGRLM